MEPDDEGGLRRGGVGGDPLRIGDPEEAVDIASPGIRVADQGAAGGASAVGGEQAFGGPSSSAR